MGIFGALDQAMKAVSAIGAEVQGANAIVGAAGGKGEDAQAFTANLLSALAGGYAAGHAHAVENMVAPVIGQSSGMSIG